MPTPLFIATGRFDPSDGEKWRRYFDWARIPALLEVVSLDLMLCPRLIDSPREEDWDHIVLEEVCFGYYHQLDPLLRRVETVRRRNILGLYRNPEAPISSIPGTGSFVFCGYDLIEDQTGISALTNCGGFPEVFPNEELNSCGLIDRFDRAREVRRLLADRYPEEPHAQCQMYALWRLNESEPCVLPYAGQSVRPGQESEDKPASDLAI